MKLYFFPNACSLAPPIVLRELALPFELVQVNNQAKTFADGEDFLQINPKGYVAALQLDNGQVLTEASAILQYLADLKPAAVGLRFGDSQYYNIALEAAKPLSDVALDSFDRRPRYTLSFSYQL